MEKYQKYQQEFLYTGELMNGPLLSLEIWSSAKSKNTKRQDKTYDFRTEECGIINCTEV